MPDVVDERLIAEANSILAAFVGGLAFAPMSVPFNNRDPDDRRHKTFIHVRAPYHTFRVRLSPRGDYMLPPKGGFAYGGTVQDAVAQLYRFTQGMTRRGRHWWERKVFYSDVVAALDATSYLDPEKVCCVLCGKVTPTCDWWADRKLKGPCCFGGECSKPNRPR